MKIDLNEINGQEDCSNLDNGQKALVEFYKAFNTKNMDLMSQNWAKQDNVSMSNPLGGIKRGWPDIKATYEKIFFGPAEVYVEFYDYVLLTSSHMFCSIGRERGYFRLPGLEIQLSIRTSRTFQSNGHRWVQVHHHGSIDNPQLLGRYQHAVLSASQLKK